MQFSVIICTYNPNEEMLKRSMLSCVHLLRYPHTAEILIIDNNSVPPLSERPCIQQLLKENSGVSLFNEERQGLAFARIQGLRRSRGATIVFADDDNVLDPAYLEQLYSLQKSHPEVAVWGPGIVEPEYLGKSPAWVARHFGYMFQEKKLQKTEYGNDAAWPDFYPSGSGMAVKREIMELYAQKIGNGELTATGRKGASLLSGEDSQIVWTAVKTGFKAGTSPLLRLIHIIPEKRQSLRYLKDLQFNIAQSYYVCFTEIFPEKKEVIRPLSTAGHLKLILMTAARSDFKPLLFWRKLVIERAWYRGIKAAHKMIHP